MSRRTDKKLIEMFMCNHRNRQDWGEFSSFLFTYTLIFYLDLSHANVEEGKEGLGEEGAKAGEGGEAPRI